MKLPADLVEDAIKKSSSTRGTWIETMLSEIANVIKAVVLHTGDVD